MQGKRKLGKSPGKKGLKNETAGPWKAQTALRKNGPAGIRLFRRAANEGQGHLGKEEA